MKKLLKMLRYSCRLVKRKDTRGNIYYSQKIGDGKWSEVTMLFEDKNYVFINEVKDEIEHLKNNTTDEEKSKLNLDNFNCMSLSNCIYGQLTGDCSSKRAKELYPKSYNSLTGYKKGNHFTALEKYLLMISQEEQIKIINYIKGITNSYDKDIKLLKSL